MSFCSEFFKSVIDEIKEPFSYTACITQGYVYVDGFLSITSIGDDKISFLVRGGRLTVLGQNLSVRKTEGDSMVISGKAEGISYEKSTL